MKNIILLCTFCISSITFGQGALAPTGVPAPSYKTLTEINQSIIGASNAVAQIETRTDIFTLPSTGASQHAIHQPGSYYLSKNLETTATKTIGITIYADDVTIDLNGFSVSHISTNGQMGIFMSMGADRCTLHNGSVREFEYGIYSQSDSAVIREIESMECGSSGIYVRNPAHLINCRAIENNGTGIYCQNDCVLTDCTAFANTLSGIEVENHCVLNRCTAFGNTHGIQTGTHCALNSCTTARNHSNGFYVSSDCTLNGCTSRRNDDQGFSVGASGSLVGCVALYNSGSYGFRLGLSCQASACSAFHNYAVGFWADRGSSLSMCTACGNTGSFGIIIEDGSLLENCNASVNTSTVANQTGGIKAGNNSTLIRCIAGKNANSTATGNSRGMGIVANGACAIQDCVVSENDGHGMLLYHNSRIAGNLCYKNGAQGNGVGIFVLGGQNRIDSNHITQNPTGLKIDADGNVIIRNSAINNAENYNITGSQTKGPTYSMSSLFIAPASPWANFSF